MTPGGTEALEALQRRLGHVKAIANMCADRDDSPEGEVVRWIALTIGDLSESLEAIIDPTT